MKNGGWLNSYQNGGDTDNEDYNMKRALELGYTPDDTGHWPSVDEETGEWLKSKKHHTRGMEMMAYELNPELRNKYNLIENEKGVLQYVDKKDFKNGGWLDQYASGGTMQEYQENYNDSKATASPDMVGDGFSNVGRNYSPAWGGQFQKGGSLPGSVGFTYARTKGIPSNGPYAKKTLASAQNGVDMYGNPILAEENYIKGEGRSNYDPRTNIINIYDLDPRYNHTRAHENYHARQFAEGRSNFDIGHNTENALWAAMQKRPEITSTEEVFDSYHNRKQKEMEMDRPDMVNIVPETRFMPSRLIDKYTDRNGLQYRNPNSMEGEAEYYGDLGEEYYKIPKGQNGMEMKYYQNGLDFKPKSISRDGGWLNKYEQGGIIKDDRGQWAKNKKNLLPLQSNWLNKF
jgi:hypothetical protein